MRRKIVNRAPAMALGGLMTMGAATVQAAGFAIIENSASGMGNAFAGAAAVAEDASTIYFNPAGMTFLPGMQLVVAGHGIFPKADYNEKGSYMNPTFTGGTAVPGTLTGPTDDGGEYKFVPNLYFSYQIDDHLFAGLGINAPFGLATNYKEGWIGRYNALESEIKTVNVNPSLAWKASDQLSIGVGVSAQYIDATLSNAVDFGSVCLGLATQAGVPRPPFPTPAQCAAQGLNAPFTGDGKAEVTGSDWSWGFNLGVLYRFGDRTRIGLAYRSHIKHDLSGTATFTVPASFQAILNAGIPLFSNTGASASVDLPETASLSLAHQLDDRWTLLADVTWTRWSRFDQLVIEYDNPNQPKTVQPENWENAWRYSIGATYRPNRTWTFRGGLAYDETPIDKASDRTPRIPGNDRTWVAVGLGYRISENLSLDVGYAHLFVRDTKIDALDHSTNHQLVGSYDSSVDILSGQLTMNF